MDPEHHQGGVLQDPTYAATSEVQLVEVERRGDRRPLVVVTQVGRASFHRIPWDSLTATLRFAVIVNQERACSGSLSGCPEIEIAGTKDRLWGSSIQWFLIDWAD